MNNDFDVKPFPNIGNNKFYKNEFCVANMLPNIGSTDGLGTEFSKKGIVDIVDSHNNEFDNNELKILMESN